MVVGDSQVCSSGWVRLLFGSLAAPFVSSPGVPARRTGLESEGVYSVCRYVQMNATRSDDGKDKEPRSFKVNPAVVIGLIQDLEKVTPEALAP